MYPDEASPSVISDQANPTRHRQSRRGCRGCLLVVAALLGAVMGIGFLAWLVQGPSIQTQFSVTNESGHEVEIDELRLDQWSSAIDKPLETRHGQKSIYYQVIGFVNVIPSSFEIAISYRYTDTDQQYSATFMVTKIREKEMCWFAIILKPEGPKVTECMRSEALDFSIY